VGALDDTIGEILNGHVEGMGVRVHLAGFHRILGSWFDRMIQPESPELGNKPGP
jgi:hypothetical protein